MSKLKVLIASGSRHSIPPVALSPGVPRIIALLTQKDFEFFVFKVVSRYDKVLASVTYDENKYLHPKIGGLWTKLKVFFLNGLPYSVKKKRYGYTQTDRIIYYDGIKGIVKKEQPDIVVTFMHFELFKKLKLALPEAKHIFFFRSTDLDGRIGKKNMEYLIDNSAGFLANTKAPILELQAFNSKINFPMATIYNAVPKVTQSLKEQEAIGRSFRSQFDLGLEHFVIGYAGRFSSEKSLMELFEVMKKLKERGTVVHLIIAGDIANEKTPDKTYYRSLMAFKDLNLEGQVHLAGWISNPDLYHFYCALDIGVLLSKYREGNSMFLIEAMSYGVPVIATNIGGNTEIISNNTNGVLIDINDLDSVLYDTLFKCTQDCDYVNKLGEHARATTIIAHQEEKMVHLFQEFLKSV